MCTCLLPEGALEERLLELGEDTVEEDVDLGVSLVSDVAERTNDSLPFETTYAVQKLGMHSEILVAVLLPLRFLKSDPFYKGLDIHNHHFQIIIYVTYNPYCYLCKE